MALGGIRDDDHDDFHPRDSLKQGGLYGIAGLGAGLLMGGVRNALQKHNVGALGAFTRSGGLITISTLGPAVFGFCEAAAGNLREKNDHWNTVIGSFLGGSLAGLHHGKISAMLGMGAFMASCMGTFMYTGGTLRAWTHENEEDDFARREEIRTKTRRPLEETVSYVGEGRGLYLPGYEERRRRRLKERYGIDINPVKATVDE